MSMICNGLKGGFLARIGGGLFVINLKDKAMPLLSKYCGLNQHLLTAW